MTNRMGQGLVTQIHQQAFRTWAKRTIEIVHKKAQQGERTDLYANAFTDGMEAAMKWIEENSAESL